MKRFYIKRIPDEQVPRIVEAWEVWDRETKELVKRHATRNEARKHNNQLNAAIDLRQKDAEAKHVGGTA